MSRFAVRSTLALARGGRPFPSGGGRRRPPDPDRCVLERERIEKLESPQEDRGFVRVERAGGRVERRALNWLRLLSRGGDAVRFAGVRSQGRAWQRRRSGGLRVRRRPRLKRRAPASLHRSKRLGNPPDISLAASFRAVLPGRAARSSPPAGDGGPDLVKTDRRARPREMRARTYSPLRPTAAHGPTEAPFRNSRTPVRTGQAVAGGRSASARRKRLPPGFPAAVPNPCRGNEPDLCRPTSNDPVSTRAIAFPKA